RHHGESLKSYPMTEQLGEVMSMGRTERRWVEKGPAGVVAIVIGASHPMRMALSALGPALAAGCTVVLKGASDTALTTLTLGELIAGCTDIPAGVVNVLSSLDPAVDRVLAADRDIDAVHFTGSISAARRFMAAAGGTAKRISCTAERKSAAIVLDDADFSVCAAQVALMTTSNAGQGSAPISRLLVPRGHSDEVVIAVGKSLAAVQYGDPADSRTWMGPLISDGRRDEVDGMVKRAIAAGATLVTGGHVVRPGYFYEPTMLTGIDPDSEMVDVCGPVLVVIPYGDDEDAARIANRCGSGPSGVVFGGYQRAVAVARRVRTGRTSKRYRRARRDIAVSLPRRDYELAGRLMADAIASSALTGVPVIEALHQIARDYGRAIADGQRAGDGKSALLLAAAVLAEHGYEPRRCCRRDPLGQLPVSRAGPAPDRTSACGMNHA
ncbi:aldehyde dehydrogenase family protein, partial [Mycolicibacterium vaccae]|nr:aldehyde dehydrogenase family protein [Mycolicibacterium vaccae]